MGLKYWHRKSLILSGLVALCPILHSTTEDEEDLSSYRQAVELADYNLNKAYSGIQSRFNDRGQSVLKSMQRSWIAFKELDFQMFVRLALSVGERRLAYRYQEVELNCHSRALLWLGRPPEEESESIGKELSAPEADKRLNEVYRICLEALPADQAAELQKIQAQWIRFRDYYCQLDAGMKDGIIADEVFAARTKRRIFQLQFYVDCIIKTRLPVDFAAGRTALKDEENEDGAERVYASDIYRFAQ